MDYIEVTDEMMDEYWCVREDSDSNEIARDAIRAAIAASPLYKRVQELEVELAKRQWQTIEGAPSDTEVLMYCPFLCESNLERVEVGVYHSTKSGSMRQWATHWMPLPEPPKGETK